ncbi:NAD(P)-dependent oxidoreductase [Tahibacter amnicola]|uniref:NAD(P)-dependent oxidoreductase n=1 Tax=Tahibacter amnicola TaxID=2976241 RepID=A0ABY6BA55_9GAMM|nr:NAD(P)-dependent oxidoreductase [Tahibacter amnicola]UXI66035.1 NAD(P)-dependent oxidoreductase [Tahibacter amnicola]
MKIALIGATGFVGTAVLAELLNRDHQVTTLSRDAAKLAPRPGLVARSVDVYDPEAVTTAVRGHHAVVSAFNPGWNEPELYALFIKGAAAIERGVEAAGVERLLVVGGAGSLYVAPGVQLVDTPEFAQHVPANIVPGARAARDTLAAMQRNTKLNWTFISPPAFLVPGERTGSYRVGGDQLLMAGEQPAGITVADLAVAIVDEIEQPKHVRARFTVARP